MDPGTLLGYFLGGLAIGAAAFGAFGRKYLESYLEEKAKNLATREDIERITNLIEGVKAQYAQLLEEQRARNQLRLAAVERRLQAHQEAYSLWRKIIAYVHKDTIGKVVMECQTWWDTNCLYLSASARDAFRSAYESAFNHQSYLQDRSNRTLIEENWARIMNAGPKIVEGVELPSLGETEAAFVGKGEEGNS